MVVWIITSGSVGRVWAWSSGMENRGLYFEEKGEKKLIDFVLVSDIPNTPEHHEDQDKRKLFLTNLKMEGLEVETSKFSEDSNRVFDKIHAPQEVLKRYGEILKMKMPIKSIYSKARKLSAETSIEGTDMLEQTFAVQDLQEPPSFTKPTF